MFRGPCTTIVHYVKAERQQLRMFGMDSKILTSYICTVQSILTGSITTWYISSPSRRTVYLQPRRLGPVPGLHWRRVWWQPCNYMKHQLFYYMTHPHTNLHTPGEEQVQSLLAYCSSKNNKHTQLLVTKKRVLAMVVDYRGVKIPALIITAEEATGRNVLACPIRENQQLWVVFSLLYSLL